MIGGLSPIMLVQFYDVFGSGFSLDDAIAKKILSEDSKIKKLIPAGLPIPIYIDERLGIMVVDENVDLSSNIEYANGKVVQTQTQRSATIKIQSNITNPIVAILLQLLQFCWENIPQNAYDISYLNDAIIVYKAKMGGLSISKNNQTSLIDITITFDMESTDSKKDGSVGDTATQQGKVAPAMPQGVGV